MIMSNNDLKIRTKQFALRIIKIVRFIAKDPVGRVLGNQLLRSGTSVAANYRAACRCKSRADFINKIGTVVEEADETQFWLELLIDAEIVEENLLISVLKESTEITAIMTSSRNSAIAHRHK